MRTAVFAAATVGAASCCCCGLDPDALLDVHDAYACREGAAVPTLFALLPREPAWQLVCAGDDDGVAMALWHGDLDGRVLAVAGAADDAMRAQGWVTTRRSAALNERVIGLRGDRQLVVGVTEALGPDHVVWLHAAVDVDLDATFERVAGTSSGGGDFDWD